MQGQSHTAATIHISLVTDKDTTTRLDVAAIDCEGVVEERYVAHCFLVLTVFRLVLTV